MSDPYDTRSDGCSEGVGDTWRAVSGAARAGSGAAVAEEVAPAVFAEAAGAGSEEAAAGSKVDLSGLGSVSGTGMEEGLRGVVGPVRGGGS